MGAFGHGVVLAIKIASSGVIFACSLVFGLDFIRKNTRENA